MAQQPFLVAPLQRAVVALKAALSAPDDEFVRDSIVKRFEFTYEIAWKLMRRHLAWAALEAPPETRRDLFRASARAGLIEDPEAWFVFHEARNLTSHTYNEAHATRVIATARQFLPAAQFLLTELERRHGD